MSAARCPACQGPVHPLFAPAPVVLADRVVMCCSESCARAQREGAVVAAASPASVHAVADGGPTEAPAPVVPEAAADPAVASPAPATDAPAAGQGAAVPEAIPSTRRPREVYGALRARIRSLPLAAALLAAGVLLIVLAVFLLFEHLASAPAVTPEIRGPSPPPGRDARTAHPGPPRASPGPRAAREGPAPPRDRTILALRQAAWQRLEGFLASEVVRFRLTAADVLAEQGHTRALDTLRQALKVELWTTRQLAAETLARLGHGDGLATLKEALGATRKPVKWAAAFALARCGDRTGEMLIKQLAYFRKYRMTANEALARLGDAGGKQFLRRVLHGSEPPYERLRAAVALGLAGDRSGLPLLQSRLREPGMHLGVALALQTLGVPEAQGALRRALDHAALRVEAARALRNYGDVSGVTEMSHTLGSPSPEVQLTGAASIVILTAQARAEVR